MAAPLMSLGAAVYSYLATPTALPRPRRGRRVLTFRATASSGAGAGAGAVLDRRRRPQNVAGDFVVGEQSSLCSCFPPTTTQELCLCLTDARCLPVCLAFSQTSAASTARPADGWRRYAGTAFSHPSPSIARFANHHSWRAACRHRHVCRRCSRGWMARPP